MDVTCPDPAAHVSAGLPATSGPSGPLSTVTAWSAADVRAAEEPHLVRETAFAGGLMDRAATALASVVRDVLHDRGVALHEATVVALVGAGNNGGDALHALARLASRGARAVALLLAPQVHDGGLAALQRAGGRVVRLGRGEEGSGADDAPTPGESSRAWTGDAAAEALGADVVLDGLLGIGARGGLRGDAAAFVDLMTDLLDELPALPGARPVVVAVDLPSGVGVDDGTVPGSVLPADLTVTFGAPKPALLLPPAAHRAGAVHVVDLGLDLDLAALGTPALRRLGAADLAARWPVPGPLDHKYLRGVVGVVAGGEAYPGAATLTVRGAQGAGAGMVRYVGPASVRAAVVAAAPEVVASAGVDVRVQAWVLGPGVDPTDTEQADLVREALGAALESGLPVVVDAGALRLLPSDRRLGHRVVLTPHAGELADLLRAEDDDVSREDVEAAPLEHVRRAHERTGATVLLKGAVTLVVGEAGVLSQAEAPPWLATAGAGDVLAGCLGALLAARPEADPREVAELAAVAASVHGRAAHRACPGGPVTAGAVAQALPATVASLLHRG